MKRITITSIFLILFFGLNAQSNIIQRRLPIAYVNIDTLLLKCKYAINANDSLIKKQYEYRQLVNSKARKLQKEMDDFQKKLETNQFQSRDLAQKEQARLQETQKELQELDAQYSNQLKQEQSRLSEDLRIKIKEIILAFNADRKYEMIFSNTSSDNILFAYSEYDITELILNALNKAYNENK
jgi:outer membrane protein